MPFMRAEAHVKGRVQIDRDMIGIEEHRALVVVAKFLQNGGFTSICPADD